MEPRSFIRCVWYKGKEREMESHSIFPSFLCLDKFYKNRNEIKSDSDGKKTPTYT